MLSFTFLLLRLHLGVCRARSGDQPAQAQVVDDVLDPLDVVLDGVGPLAENVILEVEQLESGKEVLEEGADGQRQGKVAESDGVCGEAAELLRQVRHGEQVLLDGEVEGVAVLDVGGHGKDGADLLESEELANLGGDGGGAAGRGGEGGEAAEPGGVEDGANGVLHGARPAGIVPWGERVSGYRGGWGGGVRTCRRGAWRRAR